MLIQWFNRSISIKKIWSPYIDLLCKYYFGGRECYEIINKTFEKVIVKHLCTYLMILGYRVLFWSPCGLDVFCCYSILLGMASRVYFGGSNIL